MSYIGNISSGLGFSFISPYGDQLRQELGMKDDLHSLLVGSVSVGGLVGCIIGGKLADMIGRKRAMTASFILITLGWGFVAFSLNAGMIFSGRIIHGLGEGMVVTVYIIYLGEVINEKYRGGAIAAGCVSVQFGIALAYILSLFITWRQSAILISLLNCGSLLCTMIIPESPLWLAQKVKTETELANAMKISYPSASTDLNRVQKKQRIKDTFSIFSTKTSTSTIISTIVPPTLLFLLPISGVFTISFFAISIVENMNIGQPIAVAIGVGLMRTVGTALGVGFVQRYGRRRSLIISAGATSTCFVLVSILLLVNSLPVSVFNWSMITLLVLAMSANSLGMTPVPWILCGEWPDMRYKVGFYNGL